MNSQMTLLAFGGKCGWPSGGGHAADSSASHDAVLGQHRAQRQAGEAQADVGEERAAVLVSIGLGVTKTRHGGVRPMVKLR